MRADENAEGIGTLKMRIGNIYTFNCGTIGMLLLKTKQAPTRWSIPNLGISCAGRCRLKKIQIKRPKSDFRHVIFHSTEKNEHSSIKSAAETFLVHRP
jgi:hypothetical protein